MDTNDPLGKEITMNFMTCNDIMNENYTKLINTDKNHKPTCQQMQKKIRRDLDTELLFSEDSIDLKSAGTVHQWRHTN